MNRHRDFEHLLSPTRIGKLNIKNRIVMAPMSAPGIANLDGSPTDYYISFLEERARGGTGLIIPGETVVDDDHRMISLGFYSRKMVSVYARLTEAIKAHGSRVFLQIAHPGGVCVRSMTGRQPVAPTSMESPRYTERPRELSKGEIQAIIEKYVQTSFWAMEAGFEGVELHGAHGFDLIGQFLSPSTNKRNDQYGGSFEGRMRFAEEIVIGVKEVCGPDFPVGLKYNGYEALKDGIDLSEAMRIGQHMEEVGVDYVHIASMTFGLGGIEYPSVSSMYSKGGGLIELSREIKKSLKSIPVVGTGGINEPELAERILKNKEVDLLALGRAFFADPYWVDKVMTKRASSIRPCIRCNLCHLRLFHNQLIKCTVNPFLSWQGKQDSIEKAKISRKVAVVGGGPAGMQAALVARERGHEVTLYEKKEEIGGNLILASVPDFKADLRLLLQYYNQALSESGIDVNLGSEASLRTIREGSFEAVVLAVGGEHILPNVEGIQSERVVTASEVFDSKEKKDVGNEVVVLGAGHVGCETAWYLSLQGKSVKVVDIIGPDEILAGEHDTNRTTLLKNLEMQGVQIVGKRTLREFDGERAVFEVEKGETESFDADMLVIAIGFKPRSNFGQALKESMPDHCIYEIGDCARPGRLLEAIHSGKLTGEKI